MLTVQLILFFASTNSTACQMIAAIADIHGTIDLPTALRHCGTCSVSLCNGQHLVFDAYIDYGALNNEMHLVKCIPFTILRFLILDSGFLKLYK